MAVTSVERGWSGSTGDTSTSGRTYEAHYKVTVDSALDQTRIIVLHFKNTPSLPFIGDAYEYGNDSDPEATLQSIKPQRDLNGSFVWNVTLSYSTEAQEQQPDKNGDPSDNPLDWQGEYSVSNTTVSVPVYSAIYLGSFQNGQQIAAMPRRQIGQGGPVVNSQNAVLDPPLMKEHPRRIFRMSVVLAEYPTFIANSVYNTINSGQVLMPIPFSVGLNAPPHTLRCTEFSGSMFFAFRSFFYRVNVELVYDRDTWIEKVPDIGLQFLIQAGDKKPGSDDTWSQTEIIDLEARGMDFIVAADAFGKSARQPMLLDGQGRALPFNQPVVYLHYLTIPQADHNQIFAPIGPINI